MMNCCCSQTNIFEDVLHYTSPAHGGWGVVKVAQLVPESYQMFVSPAACGRHGALAACIEDRKKRLSYLFLSEDDIVSGGYEDLIIQGAKKLLAHLEKVKKTPKVLMIFVSCIDDLLGTDHEPLRAELSEIYPDIKFTFCHMNPTSMDTKIPPVVNLQNKMYELLDVSKERDRGVNMIGSFETIREKSELFEVLKSMDVNYVRHISDEPTFEGYQNMAKSCLNLVIAPSGKYASRNMETKHGIGYEVVLTSFQPVCIRENYEKLAKKLCVDCPDLATYEARCEDALKETVEFLNGMPIVIDEGAILRPFDLAKVLLENGFNVTHIFQQKVLPTDKENYNWVIENYPEVNIMQPRNPKVTLFEKFNEESLAIGYSAAYVTGAFHVVDINGQHGLYGYNGLIELLEMMRNASMEKADLKKIIDDAVLVV